MGRTLNLLSKGISGSCEAKDLLQGFFGEFKPLTMFAATTVAR